MQKKKKKVITVHRGYPYTFSFEEHKEELKFMVNKWEKIQWKNEEVLRISSSTNTLKKKKKPYIYIKSMPFFFKYILNTKLHFMYCFLCSLYSEYNK